jgi:hypothetical protein
LSQDDSDDNCLSDKSSRDELDLESTDEGESTSEYTEGAESTSGPTVIFESGRESTGKSESELLSQTSESANECNGNCEHVSECASRSTETHERASESTSESTGNRESAIEEPMNTDEHSSHSPSCSPKSKHPILAYLLMMILSFWGTEEVVMHSCFDLIYRQGINYLVTLVIILLLSVTVLFKFLQIRKAKGINEYFNIFFRFIFTYNFFVLIYSLVVYPILFRNGLFWTEYGGQSGCICVPRMGRTVFIVENFYQIYLTVILPLSGIVLLIAYLKAKSSYGRIVNFKEFIKFKLQKTNLLLGFLRYVVIGVFVLGLVSLPLLDRWILNRYEHLENSAKGYYAKNIFGEVYFISGEPYFEDSEYIYLKPTAGATSDYKTKLPRDFDLETMEVIDAWGGLIKDKNHIYYNAQIWYEVDLETFEILSLQPAYYKDKENVYYGREVIQGADPSSFRYLSIGGSGNQLYWAQDNDMIYFKGLSTGYDPMEAGFYGRYLYDYHKKQWYMIREIEIGPGVRDLEINETQENFSTLYIEKDGKWYYSCREVDVRAPDSFHVFSMFWAYDDEGKYYKGVFTGFEVGEASFLNDGTAQYNGKTYKYYVEDGEFVMEEID